MSLRPDALECITFSIKLGVCNQTGCLFIPPCNLILGCLRYRLCPSFLRHEIGVAVRQFQLDVAKITGEIDFHTTKERCTYHIIVQHLAPITIRQIRPLVLSSYYLYHPNCLFQNHSTKNATSFHLQLGHTLPPSHL